MHRNKDLFLLKKQKVKERLWFYLAETWRARKRALPTLFRFCFSFSARAERRRFCSEFIRKPLECDKQKKKRFGKETISFNSSTQRALKFLFLILGRAAGNCVKPTSNPEAGTEIERRPSALRAVQEIRARNNYLERSSFP